MFVHITNAGSKMLLTHRQCATFVAAAAISGRHDFSSFRYMHLFCLLSISLFDCMLPQCGLSVEIM